jgi:transcriptional regulator with XRE-family HTH domain
MPGPRRRRRDGPHPIDVHVGRRIRQRRLFLGMNQTALGEALDDLTFQQIQKYELGANRVSASRLLEIARALKVPVSYFFAEIPDARETQLEQRSRERMEQPETIDLIRAYYAIPADMRPTFLKLVEAASKV